MDTVAQNGPPLSLAELPMAEDGLVDFRKLDFYNKKQIICCHMGTL